MDGTSERRIGGTEMLTLPIFLFLWSVAAACNHSQQRVAGFRGENTQAGERMEKVEGIGMGRFGRTLHATIEARRVLVVIFVVARGSVERACFLTVVSFTDPPYGGFIPVALT